MDFYSYYVTRSLDVWAVFAWLVAAAAIYAIVQLWRGMRLDDFERAVRRLREQPQGAIEFPPRSHTPSTRVESPRILQIRLLPLMLVSVCASMLIAQAVRPDETSRLLTWTLFIATGTWYGTHWWIDSRGINALRNCVWGGVASGLIASSSTWAFYLGVDLWHGDPAFGRIQSSFSVLLWWTAVGSVAGSFVGAFRSNRFYRQARYHTSSSNNIDSQNTVTISVATEDNRRLGKRRAAQTLATRWGLLGIGCLASLLFHLSAAPHVHRVVHYRLWNWHWNSDFRRQPSLTLTMAPLDANALAPANRDLDIPFTQTIISYDPVQDLELLDDHLEGHNDLHEHDHTDEHDHASEPARPNVMQAPTVTLYNGPVPYVVGVGYPSGPVAMNRNVSKGELITTDMIIPLDEKLPSGAAPLEAAAVVGRYAATDIPADTPIFAKAVSLTPTTSVTLNYPLPWSPPDPVFTGNSRAAPQRPWISALRRMSDPGPSVIGPGPGLLPGVTGAEGDVPSEPNEGPPPTVAPQSSKPLIPTEPALPQPPPSEEEPIRYEKWIGMRVTVATAAGAAKTNGVLVAVVEPKTETRMLVLHTETGRVDVPIEQITNIFPSDTGR